MAQKNQRILLGLLILVTGLIPIPAYFLKTNTLVFNLDITMLPSRDLIPLEQLGQAFAGLFVKPIYMILSLGIILALIGQKRLPIRTLQWGLIAFLVGETFCAINFYFYKHESMLSEYLHSYGMVLAIGFSSFALIEGWMARFVRQTSLKSTSDARGLFLFLIPSLAVLCFIPLLSPTHPAMYSVTIFGFPYSYTRPEFYEFYEHQILPILAIISFTVSFVILLLNRNSISRLAKVFLCAGLGFLGFSFFRVVLNALFADNLVWFEFWEEVTELMFVSAIGFVLWKFKNTLLGRTTILENFSDFLK